jgi:hypothetical protein
MPPKNGHKVERELTTSQRNQIVVDLANGAISPERVGEKYGFSGNSVRRWWKIVPEDEKMLLVAQDRQRRDVAAKRHAADMIVSDGDDIDNDLRWLISARNVHIQDRRDHRPRFVTAVHHAAADHSPRTRASPGREDGFP